VPVSRVLVVDDHLATLEILDTFLSLSGFSVTLAGNGSQAMELASDGFDAVLTDLAMPGMDGRELIQELRSRLRSRPIPIVVVSGLLQADPAGLSGVSYCGLMKKPCNLGALAARLRLLIDTCPHNCSGCPHLRGAAPQGDVRPALC